VPEEEGLSGKIMVSFIVETDGSLSNIKVLKDIGYGSGAEAIRVLKKSPKWMPGKQNGKPVRVEYTMPISISSSKQE
jgi:protein TonB